jgi:hypothetical protein
MRFGEEQSPPLSLIGTSLLHQSAVESGCTGMTGPPDLELQSTGRGAVFFLRAITLVLFVPGLLVLGWAAFGLQGYKNDPGSAALQTWPAGAASIFLAACLAWIAIRPSPHPLQMVITVVAGAALAATWIAAIS